jgi:hypothetical protein
VEVATLNYIAVTPHTMGINPVERPPFRALFNRNPHPIVFRAVFATPKAFQGYLTFDLAIGFSPAVEEIPLYRPIQDF